MRRRWWGALAASLVVGPLGPGSAVAGEAPSVATQELTVRHQPADEVASPVIVDGLAPETVLTVRAVGFSPDTSGSVAQCTQGQGRRCTNALGVRFDDLGSATFQYLVTDEIAGAPESGLRCRLGQPRCAIEVRAGSQVSVVETVFVDRVPPPGRLQVTPSEGLEPGEEVRITVEDLRPGAELAVAVCADPSTSGPRCGAPGPEAALTVGPEGGAVARLILDVDEVGTDRVACGRRVRCRVVATSDEAGVRVTPMALSFRGAAGADYAWPRVAAGLLVAVALLLVAWHLLHTTSWRPPGEADASTIDDAELADLDQEAARFTEEHSHPS